MAKKVILIVVGSVALLLGLGLLAVGGGLAAAVGWDNTLHTGYHQFGTPTTAVISEATRIEEADSFPYSGWGTTTITMTARSDRSVFIGIGPADEVERYLGASAFEEVTDLRFTPYRVRTELHDGFGKAGPPTERAFWSASDTGTTPSLEWRVTDGDYRIVLMNVDGSPGVGAETRFGIKINGLFGIGVAIFAVGALFALVGVALIVWGIRTSVPPAQPAYAGGGPMPTPSRPGGPPGAGPPPGQPPPGQPPPGQPPPGQPPPGQPPPGQPPPGQPPPGQPPPPGQAPPPEGTA